MKLEESLLKQGFETAPAPKTKHVSKPTKNMFKGKKGYSEMKSFSMNNEENIGGFDESVRVRRAWCCTVTRGVVHMWYRRLPKRK